MGRDKGNPRWWTSNRWPRIESKHSKRFHHLHSCLRSAPSQENENEQWRNIQVLEESQKRSIVKLDLCPSSSSTFWTYPWTMTSRLSVAWRISQERNVAYAFKTTKPVCEAKLFTAMPNLRWQTTGDTSFTYPTHFTNTLFSMSIDIDWEIWIWKMTPMSWKKEISTGISKKS